MAEPVMNATFGWHLEQAKKEIELVLSVNDYKHREEAREIAVSAIRKLLELLPNMKRFEKKEKAAIALLALVNWQANCLIPEVLGTMDVIFDGAPPKEFQCI